jgi:DNA modification methylase
LRTFPDESIDCCVTSPPYYGLRDYGVDGQIGLEATPEAYVAKLVEVFREVRRCLKNEGTLWLNLGDTYAANRDHQVAQTKDQTRIKRACGNFNNMSMAVPDGLKPKDLIGIPWMVAFALRADGWYLRSDIIWHKPNCMPESVTDRPTKSHEYLFLLSKSKKYYYDSVSIQEDSITKDPRKPYTSEGTKNLDGRKIWHSGEKRESGDFTKRNARTVWTIPTKPFPGSHFAVMPERLVEPCILAGCPEGGLVLDPFFGAGTVGLVAKKLGRAFIGIELNADYIAMAEKRIAQTPMPLTAWGRA